MRPAYHQPHTWRTIPTPTPTPPLRLQYKPIDSLLCTVTTRTGGFVDCGCTSVWCVCVLSLPFATFGPNLPLACSNPPPSQSDTGPPSPRGAYVRQRTARPIPNTHIFLSLSHSLLSLCIRALIFAEGGGGGEGERNKKPTAGPSPCGHGSEVSIWRGRRRPKKLKHDSVKETR